MKTFEGARIGAHNIFMGFQSLFSVNKEKILEWVNTGSLIAFVVVLAMVLIAFLFGLLRGWKSGTYHFIARALLFIVPLFFLGPIANALGGINLAQWIQGPIQLVVNGKTMQVEVGTAFDTVYQFVYIFLHDILQLEASASQIANYAIALTGSLIRLVLVAVWAFITWTIGSLLITLLWHIAFKHIIPKEKRRPKLRIISAFEEMLAFVGILVVGIAPISGLINGVKNNAQIPDSKNETVMLVRDVINTYDNSIFNQAFFAWTKGSGKDTLDTQIAEFFAQNSYTVDARTYNANVIKEIRVFAGAEGAISAALVADKPQNALASSLIHTSLLIGQSLYLMAEGENELLDTFVPLAYDIADNAEFLMEEFGENALFGDFAKSKKDRIDAFDRVASSAFVSTIEAPSEKTTFLPVYDGLSSFSEYSLDRIESKMAANPKAREYVNALLSGYVYQDYENNDGSIFNGLLPLRAMGELDEERFATIDWFKEATIYRNTHDTIASLPRLNAGSSQTSDEEMIADFLARAAKHMDKIIDAIVGPRDESGKPIVNDKGERQGDVCLLDSDLLNVFMPAVLQYGAMSINDTVLVDPEDPKDFLTKTASIAEKLSGNPDNPAESKVNYKQEFGHILDVIGDLTKHPAGQAFLADYKNHPGLEFAQDGTLIDFDPGIAEAFMQGIVNVDSSQLFTYAAPIMGDHYVRPMLAPDGALGKMGIKKLDFHCQALGQRLSELLSVGKYCNGILTAFGSLFKTEGQTAIDPNNFFSSLTAYETETKNYQVTHLLDILASSPILNPVYDIAGKQVTNCNIANLLQNFLKGIDSDTKFHLDEDALDGMKLVGEWEGEKLKTKGDNYFTVQVFKQIAETGIIEEFAALSESSSTQAIQTLSTLGIEDLFANIGHSQVLRKLLPPFFDTNLLGTLLNSDKSLDLEAIGVTYKNLVTPEDWAAEGAAMQAILNLAANGLDLSNVDVFDPVIVDLMGELAASRMFVQPDGTYVFGTFFADKLLQSLSDANQFKLFTDYPNKQVAAFGNKTVKTVLEEKGDAYWNGKTASVLEDKKALASVFVEAMQLPETSQEWIIEIGKLREAVSSISGIGGIDALSEFKSDSVPSLSIALNAICDMDTLGSVLPGNVFRKAFESGNVSDAISLEDVNLGWLFRNGEQFVQAMKDSGGDRSAPAVKTVLDARDAEMEKMLSLIVLAANNESLKSGQINFATLNADGLLRPLFFASGNSKVLNPSSADDLYSVTETLPELSVFENLILTFVKNSGVYRYVDADGNPVPEYTKDNLDTAFVYGTKKTLKSIIKSISTANLWEEETNALCNLVGVLQGSSFLKDGQISFDVFSSEKGLKEFFAREGSKEELVDLMVALEQSELYYRCLPAKLEKAITDALTTVTFGHLREDIACADFYLYVDDLKKDFPRYTYEGPNNTVEGLVNVFASLSSCTGINMSDFSTVDVDAVTSALSDMAISPIFNSNTEKSKDAFATVAPERRGMTSFQALFCDVLDVEALRDYAFYAASPKDAYHVAESHYSNASTKTAYVIKTLFPVLDGTNTPLLDELAFRYIENELGTCLTTVKEDRFSGFISGSASFSDLDEESFTILLNSLNNCTLLRDCVPNAAHKTLISDDTISIEGIALSSADVFFSYYYHDGEGEFSPVRKVAPDFDMPFYRPEIDIIASIYSTLNNTKTKEIMSNMQMKTLDPMLVRNILLDLHDSYIFHEAAKENRDTASSPIVNPGDPSVIENFPSLTVFEQFIYKVLYKATLLDMNYSDGKFFQFAFDEDGNYRDTGRFYKGYSDILAITNGSDNWLSEINALTTDGLRHNGLLDASKDPIVGIIAAAQNAGMFEESSGVSVDFESLKKISPVKIRSLLYSLNNSELLKDALPLSLTSFLGTSSETGTGIGLDRFTKNTFTSAVTLGGTSIDMKDVGALFEDGDNTKTFHPVSEILLPVSSELRTGSTLHFSAIYHKDATTDIDMTPLFVTSGYDPVAKTELIRTKDRIYVPLEITLKDGVTFENGNAEFVVDYADYDIGRDGYADTGIDAIGYLLSSAYRGKDYANRFFSFGKSGDSTLSTFFDEYEDGDSAYDHSTYGLLALFADSGFYEAKLDAAGNFTSSDTPNHTTAAYALYNAFNFKISAAVDVSVTIDSGPYAGVYPLPTISELSMGGLIGKGNTPAEHLKSIEEYLCQMTLDKMDFITKEAYWFDTYAAAAGTFAAYDTVHKVAFDTSYVNEIKYFLLSGIDLAFSMSPNDAVAEIVKSLRSTTYDYTISVPLSDEVAEPHSGAAVKPDIGRSVIANLLLSNGAHKGNGLDLAAMPDAFGIVSKKSTRIASIEFDDDLFGSDYALMDEEYLGEIATGFMIMRELYLDDSTALTTEQKTFIHDSFASLKDTGGASKFTHIFYLASLYDLMIAPAHLNGVFSLATLTNLSSYLADGQIAGVPTPLTFANVASLYA